MVCAVSLLWKIRLIPWDVHSLISMNAYYLQLLCWATRVGQFVVLLFFSFSLVLVRFIYAVHTNIFHRLSFILFNISEIYLLYLHIHILHTKHNIDDKIQIRNENKSKTKLQYIAVDCYKAKRMVTPSLQTMRGGNKSLPVWTGS